MNVERLNDIFQFLIRNRVFNKELQTRYYSGIVNPKHTTQEKVISLLYHTASTQSRPNINSLAVFYQDIHIQPDRLNSFVEFISVLDEEGKLPKNYLGLFKGLRKKNGWGDKTAALFVKTVFHLHNGEYPSDLKIWDDAPTDLKDDDSFFLPVDAVILKIFESIKPGTWNFRRVNKELAGKYRGKDIEVWDDLWFWGFITQKGAGNHRTMEWNLSKYWVLKETDKNPVTIEEIQTKAEEFLRILS